VRLSGTVHPLARAENDRGAVPDSFPANRMLVLLNPPAERQQALQQFLHDAHAKGSPAYHQWLTPEQFGARFGARDEDVQQVQSWLQSHGFAITRLTKSGRFLEFSGTAAQVREGLHAAIHQYEIEGKTYYSVASEVSVPQSIAPLLKGFAPLNTFPLTSYVHSAGTGTLSRTSNRVTPDFTTTNSSGATFYALSPEDFATQYNLTPLYQAGTNGAGATIGIIDELNLNLAVVDAYRRLYGLPAADPQVVIDGEDPGVGLSPTVEGFLDVELAGAVAPSATVNYYIAGGSHFQSTLLLAAMRAVEDNQADILSVSYGECEALLGPLGNQTWNSLWEQAAAQGQTALVATGDSGSATCVGQLSSASGQITYLGPDVNGLASTPWNVAVGGTDFYYSDYATGGASATTSWNATNDANFGSLKASLPEQPWDNPLGFNVTPLSVTDLEIPGGAGGGGPSTCAQFVTAAGQPPVCASGYAKPSWQIAPGVPADSVRDLPDVALFAANGANLSTYAICINSSQCTAGETNPSVYLVGGTSASTPAMAGIMALVKQKYGRQGQADFTLYALARQQPAVFHDITLGTNDVLCFTGPPACDVPVTLPGTIFVSNIDSYGVYAAGPGYDLASGLGSLDANALVSNWSKVTFLPTSTALQISPASIVHGTPVSLATTVKPATGSNTPTGDVNIATSAAVPLITSNFITLSAGAGTTNWNFFPGGSYEVTAKYAGDGTFAGSSSAPSALAVTPEPSTTALTLQYEYENSSTPTVEGFAANGAQLPLSSLWTFAAQPSGQTSQLTGDATGTATFTDGATSVTVPMNVQGVATWSPQILALGAHSVTVSYSGDASYNSSTAGPLTFTVTKGLPLLRATLEAQQVLTLSNPPTATYPAGTPVVVHVLVSALNSFVKPTGMVTVSLSPNLSQTVALIPDNYSNQGLSAVNVTFPSVPAGAYTLNASYAGDSNWTAVASSPEPLTFAAMAVATTTTLSVTPASVDSSGSVTFSVTLTSTVPQPGGLVNLSANGTNFASIGMNSNSTTGLLTNSGSVTVPATAIPSGSLQIVALYMGGLDFAPSSSAPVPLTVTFTDFTLSSSSSRVIVKSGQSTSLPLLLGGPNGGSAMVSLNCLASGNFNCSLNPSSMTVKGSTTASLTIQAFINATGTTASVNPSGPLGRGLFAASAGFAFAFALIFVAPNRQRYHRHYAGLQFCCAILAAASFIGGCGGGSSVSAPPPPPQVVNTPPGTYNVVVTGGSGAVVHNTSIIVVVQ